jgi:hypothetical protein
LGILACLRKTANVDGRTVQVCMETSENRQRFSSTWRSPQWRSLATLGSVIRTRGLCTLVPSPEASPLPRRLSQPRPASGIHPTRGHRRDVALIGPAPSINSSLDIIQLPPSGYEQRVSRRVHATRASTTHHVLYCQLVNLKFS